MPNIKVYAQTTSGVVGLVLDETAASPLMKIVFPVTAKPILVSQDGKRCKNIDGFCIVDKDNPDLIILKIEQEIL